MLRLETISKQVKNSLTITDSRNGKSYDMPITDEYLKASDMQKIKDNDKILRLYDPGYMNTINCTSKISFIDGDKGILEYRGYSIEELAEKSTFLEVAFLLIFGELPSVTELASFQRKVMTHTFVHNDVNEMMKSFRYDAHPMGMFCSTMSALSTLHPESNPSLAGEGVYKDKKLRNKQIYRLLGNVPTLAANAYRHRIGKEYNLPAPNLGYVENFLYMMDRINQNTYRPHPKLVRALEVLFILHAQHEINCSTAAVRHLNSSGVDVYTVIAGGAGALYGPKHGGANEAVLRMLTAIGNKSNIPQFIEDVKNKKQLLYGFGHRVYKSYDPRATIVKKIAHEVFEVTGKEPLVEIALELEKIALNDKYFIERKLYPNVDFYTGVIYKAMGFPTDMFPLLFTIPRVAGWIAHWNQFLDDPENKIVRPRQNYQGYDTRAYTPLAKRGDGAVSAYLDCVETATSKRNEVSRAYES